MYSIGEFSRISGLSIKALRLYHEKGILVPSLVDEGSGYRYYDRKNAEQARIVRQLRDLDFSLKEISEVFEEIGNEGNVVDQLEAKRREILARLRREQAMIKNLEQFIRMEREAMMVRQDAAFEIQEKMIDPVLAAGIRFKGKYSDCGSAFGKIAKSMGWNLNGKAFNLYYDEEYKEADADIESCMPVRRSRAVPGISVREFPGGHCVALVHKGPYDTIGHSYEKIMAYIREKRYRIRMPIREVYLKGPGIIFRGNPKHYLTEIQIFVQSEP